MIRELLDTKVQKFIQDHLSDDPVSLLLKSNKYTDIPLKEVVTQIKARQDLKHKLPGWVAEKCIIFPPTLSQEQSSSQKTAEYKASIISGQSLIDLTGGAGVDTFYLSKSFSEVTYIEPNIDLFELGIHNLTCLGALNIKFFNSKAEDFLLKDSANKADWLYLDPDRRGNQNKKLYLLSDGQPDVIRFLPHFFTLGNKVLIKTSPMLDIARAIDKLKKVSEVHVVAVNNEVKEVLYIVEADPSKEISITTCNLIEQNNFQKYQYNLSEELNAEVHYSLPLNYLYEPNVAILKSGAFKSIAKAFSLLKLHSNSHLYTSLKIHHDFPGRKFKIIDAISYNKKALLSILPAKKANITVRNFPYSVQEIRNKTGVKEGGEIYLFATTDLNGKPVIIVTNKIQNI
ncbi:hypothetical protein BH23BAC1_BH23BAC1_02420 [soil metagenome]